MDGLRLVQRVILSIALITLADPARADAPQVAADPSVRLEAYSAGLRQQFPDVPVITTAELAARSPQPVILDVRDAREFGVSRLPGALLLSQDPLDQLKKHGVRTDDLVVVYCSVGYRSAQLARRLASNGYHHVRNLEGSIFQWANEGRPLVNNTGPTTDVHPYDRQWGRMLDHRRWAWHPSQPNR